MITVPHKRVHKNQFLVPFPFFILFILEAEKSSDEYFIVIHNLAEPPRIHYNYFLTALIPDLFFAFVPQNLIIQFSGCSNGYDDCFYLLLFFNGKIYHQFVSQPLINLFPFLLIPGKKLVICRQCRPRVYMPYIVLG